MKPVHLRILLFLLLPLLGFRQDTPGEEKISYEIIASGRPKGEAPGIASYFTFDNIYDFDDFWNNFDCSCFKPYVDFKTSKVIVFTEAGEIDKLTVSSESINIYTTIVKQNSPWGIEGPGPAWRVIRINYDGKPVKWFERILEEK